MVSWGEAPPTAPLLKLGKSSFPNLASCCCTASQWGIPPQPRASLYPRPQPQKKDQAKAWSFFYVFVRGYLISSLSSSSFDAGTSHVFDSPLFVLLISIVSVVDAGSCPVFFSHSLNCAGFSRWNGSLSSCNSIP